MIELRKMGMGDLMIFKKWLSEPHVAKWYEHPLDWIYEIEKQDSEFNWIHHYIVEHEGNPIGFCQYYACKDSDELWGGYTKSVFIRMRKGLLYSRMRVIKHPAGYCCPVVLCWTRKRIFM